MNPNAVKVVFDDKGLANYFSRAPFLGVAKNFSLALSSQQLPTNAEYYRHIGIYAYRVGFLHSYVSWPPSMTEVTESLEQLRALANGVRIHVDVALETPPAGVDTAEDLERVRELIEAS